jgi:hypothetical protein
MWNRSYRWQRRTRLVAGVAVLIASFAGLVLCAGSAPSKRARAGARDLLSDVYSASERTIDVDVPADLNARAGTLVYLDRDDGIAQVVGRVSAVRAVDAGRVTLEIRMTAPLAGTQNLGGTLRGAAASLDLRDALRLLVSPDTLDEEVLLARDAIWPSVQQNVLPDLIDGLIRETIKELAVPDRQDVILVAKAVESLRATLEPLEGELLDRLTKRAWDVVGIPGIAAGIWRSTADASRNGRLLVTDWWRKLLGRKADSDAVDRPFLSAEMTERLETALKEETLAFWDEHRSTIVQALTKVALDRRADFEAAFRDRWGALLYERAIEPAWQAGQDHVLAAVQTYAADFAARRLLTKDGGPRLLLAYALRSSLQISDDPLLVLAPGSGGDSRQTVYEPMIR